MKVSKLEYGLEEIIQKKHNKTKTIGKYKGEGDKYEKQSRSAIAEWQAHRKKENGKRGNMWRRNSWDFLRTNKRHKSRSKELKKNPQNRINKRSLYPDI